MDKKIQEHFNNFYFNYTFSNNDDSIINGVHVFNSSYKNQPIDCEKIFKDKDVILYLNYGGPYNRKYGFLSIKIYKDYNYKGKEKGNISKLVNELVEFINNNQRLYYQNNCKYIKNEYGENLNDGKKYEDILSIDKVKHIDIYNLNITDDVVRSLSIFKNVSSFGTKKCNYTNTNISNIHFSYFNDANSNMNGLNIFNHCVCDSIYLDGTNIGTNFDKVSTINCKNFLMVDVNTNYEDLFMCTKFSNTLEMRINSNKKSIVLNPIDIELLPIFYDAKEIEVYGNAYTLDFLSKMHELETFHGKINIIDNDYINKLKKGISERIRERAKRDPNFSIANYLTTQRILKCSLYKKILADLSIPRYSMVEWSGRLENKTDKEISKDVKYYESLPIKVRQKIGTSNGIDFIDINKQDFYKELGIQLYSSKRDEIFHIEESLIYGPYGNKITRISKNSYGEYVIPVYESDGSIGSRIFYYPGEKINYEGYYDDIFSDKYVNSKLLFDSYYNYQLSNDKKISYLLSLIDHDDIIYGNKEYRDKLDKKNNILNELNYLENIEYDMDIIDVLKSSIEKYYYHNLVGIDKNNLFDYFENILDIDVIKDMVNKYFICNNFNDSMKKLYMEEIIKYVNNLNQITRLNNELNGYNNIISGCLNIRYKSLMENLSCKSCIDWYIDDITKFLSNYNLSKEEFEFFTNYILYIQESEKSTLLREQTKLGDKIASAGDYGYDMNTLSYYLQMNDCSNLDELYNKKFIARTEYNKFKYIEDVIARNDKIDYILNRDKRSREEAYIELIPKIDNLTINDYKEIKDIMPVMGKYCDKFSMFVDVLYYYINGDYPIWIKTEMMKNNAYGIKHEKECSKLYTICRKAYTRVSDNPFD